MEGREFKPMPSKEERIAEINKQLEMYRTDVNPEGGLSGQDLVNAEREIKLLEKELEKLQGENK